MTNSSLQSSYMLQRLLTRIFKQNSSPNSDGCHTHTFKHIQYIFTVPFTCDPNLEQVSMLVPLAIISLLDRKSIISESTCTKVLNQQGLSFQLARLEIQSEAGRRNSKKVRSWIAKLKDYTHFTWIFMSSSTFVCIEADITAVFSSHKFLQEFLAPAPPSSSSSRLKENGRGSLLLLLIQSNLSFFSYPLALPSPFPHPFLTLATLPSPASLISFCCLWEGHMQQSYLTSKAVGGVIRWLRRRTGQIVCTPPP